MLSNLLNNDPEEKPATPVESNDKTPGIYQYFNKINLPQ